MYIVFFVMREKGSRTKENDKCVSTIGLFESN